MGVQRARAGVFLTTWAGRVAGPLYLTRNLVLRALVGKRALRQMWCEVITAVTQLSARGVTIRSTSGLVRELLPHIWLVEKNSSRQRDLGEGARRLRHNLNSTVG